MTVKLEGVEKINVDPQLYFNEVRTLRFLSQGLISLASNVHRREQRYAHLAQKMNFTQFGASSQEEEAELNLIACFFHWFGVSVVNYARLVGFIRGLHLKLFSREDLKDKARFKDISEKVKAYVVSVPELTNVLIWRNKVAGHFAITDPWRDDNIATLNMSVTFPVTLDNGIYHVGGLQMTMTNAAGIHVSEIAEWSVTQVFDALVPRYWPGFKDGTDRPLTGQNPPSGGA